MFPKGLNLHSIGNKERKIIMKIEIRERSILHEMYKEPTLLKTIILNDGMVTIIDDQISDIVWGGWSISDVTVASLSIIKMDKDVKEVKITGKKELTIANSDLGVAIEHYVQLARDFLNGEINIEIVK